MRTRFRRLTLFALVLLAGGAAYAVRVETLATIKGMQALRVSGEGLVTGLDGTGDDSPGARRLLARFLDKHGINISQEEIAAGSVALVDVTAEIPPAARPGVVVPVLVSAVNNAESLENGVLARTFLRVRPGGPVYVVASGRLQIGGDGGNQYLTTATIPPGRNAGGQVVRENGARFISENNTFELLLKEPSFANAHAIAQAINSTGETNPFLEQVIEEQAGRNAFDIRVRGTAQALDPGTVIVKIPANRLDQKVEYIMSVMKNVNVSVDVPPRVVIDRATNNVTITGEVRLSRAAIIQGNLSVLVEQPEALAPPQFALQDPQRRPVVELSDSLGQTENLQTLINTLNAMQVTPRDVANIIQKLHRAGALHGELIIE